MVLELEVVAVVVFAMGIGHAMIAPNVARPGRRHKLAPRAHLEALAQMSRVPHDSPVSIAIELPERDEEKLRTLAEKLGVSLADAARMLLGDKLAELGDDFGDAADFAKNAELYRRLS